MFKKIFLMTVLLLAMTLSCQIPSLGYAYVGASSDHDSSVCSSMVLGGMTADGQTIFKIFNGFELALGFGREYGDAYSWDCPHDDYTIIDEKNPDFLGGFDFLRRTTFSDDFALYGGVGLYVTTSSTIAESNVTGWRYIHGSEVDTAISYSYGIQIKRLIVGFHSIRGNYVAIVLGKF